MISIFTRGVLTQISFEPCQFSFFVRKMALIIHKYSFNNKNKIEFTAAKQIKF